MAGARLRRILPCAENVDKFCLTYDDGLGDIDVTVLIDSHGSHERRATVTSLENGQAIWERRPLQRLAADDELKSYRNSGFWQPTDMIRERQELEELSAAGDAPWKVWS